MLYIDPTDSLRPLLVAAAAAAGCTLRVCPTASDALMLLDGSSPLKLVVVGVRDGDGSDGKRLDWRGGLDLIRAIRQRPLRQAVPILLALDRPDPALASAAFQEGATEIFLYDDERTIAESLERHLYGSQFHDHRLCGLSGRVLIVEDNPIFAELIDQRCRVLGLDTCLCSSVDAGVALLEQHQFDFAIIDVVLDGLQSGLALVRHIRSQPEHARLPVLVISGYNDTVRRLEALRAGADDYLEKPFAEAELVWRLQRMNHDQPTIQPSRPLPPVDSPHEAYVEWLEKGLSQRELAVCQALLRGLTDKEISAELGISFWTVRSHVGSVFTKLGLLNRRELLTRYPQPPEAQ